MDAAFDLLNIITAGVEARLKQRDHSIRVIRGSAGYKQPMTVVFYLYYPVNGHYHWVRTEEILESELSDTEAVIETVIAELMAAFRAGRG